jgi:hypothetical protein
LPDELICKIDFGDLAKVAEELAAILLGRRKDSSAVRKYVQEHYGLAQTLDAYMDAITKCELGPRLQERELAMIRSTDMLAIPPWCALVRRGYYNDYEYRYANSDRLVAAAATLSSASRSVASLVADGFLETELQGWYRDGYFVRT